MASKRQTTMAKIAREQAVRERRARKEEKREKKRAAALAKANPETADGSGRACGRRRSGYSVETKTLFSSVLCTSAFHPELLADPGLLVAAEGRLREDGAVRVDADRAGAERPGNPQLACAVARPDRPG